MEDRHVPVFSFEDSRIAEVQMITETNDPRWPKPSSNFIFTLDPNFTTGDSIANYTMSVIDPRTDAYAAIYAVDRAGNDTVYEYRYASPVQKLAIDPSPPYYFDSVKVGGDSCMTITVSDTSSLPLFISNVNLTGYSAYGTLSLQPALTDTLLLPRSSAKFNLCFTPKDSIAAVDLGFQVHLGACDSVLSMSYSVSGKGFIPFQQSVAISQSRRSLLGAFPNPVSGTATISFELQRSEDVSARLYDITGRLVWNSNSKMLGPGKQSINLDATTFPNGTYRVELQVGEVFDATSLTVLH
jgi:hypothetical protein